MQLYKSQTTLLCTPFHHNTTTLSSALLSRYLLTDLMFFRSPLPSGHPAFRPPISLPIGPGVQHPVVLTEDMFGAFSCLIHRLDPSFSPPLPSLFLGLPSSATVHAEYVPLLSSPPPSLPAIGSCPPPPVGSFFLCLLLQMRHGQLHTFQKSIF